MSWTNLPADDSTDWSSVEFLNQFVDAYNERYLSLRQVVSSEWLATRYFFSPHGLLPQIKESDDIARSEPFSSALKPTVHSLQLWVHRIWSASVDPSSLWYTPGQPTGPVDTSGLGGVFGFVLDPLSFTRVPSSRNWTRKYPREIDNLSDSGQAGWRARYLNTAAKNRADIYEHDGTGWVLSEDQITKPDTIEVVGPEERLKPGDYIGPWIFNEMWERLKEATHFMGGFNHESTPWAISQNESAGSTAWSWPTMLGASAAQAEAQADWPTPDLGWPPEFYAGGYVRFDTPAVYSFYGTTNGNDNNYRAGLYSNVITYTPPALNVAGAPAPPRVFDVFAFPYTSDPPSPNLGTFYPGLFSGHGWGLAEDHVTPVGLGISSQVTIGNNAQPSFVASPLPRRGLVGDGFVTSVAVVVRPTYEFQ